MTKQQINSEYIYIRSVMNLMWFAVPCFLMLTGLLLLLPKKQIDIRTLYKKYVLKILIVLGIFGIIFSWMEIVFSQKTINVFKFLMQSLMLYKVKHGHIYGIYIVF